jgi:hypothetical protein
MGGMHSGSMSHRSSHGNNGMSHNGMSHNGMSHNGMSHNDMSHNGMSHNGMSQGHGRVATRTAGSFSHSGAFGHGFGPGFHRFGVFGWVGPLFWPYAYNDVYCSVFWGYWGYGCADPYWAAAYGDPFWDYGYADIQGALFSPFAAEDLAPYQPDGEDSVSAARSGATQDNAIGQMCGDDTKDVANWPVDRIQQLVLPDEQQRMALDELANASMKAAQIIKSGCPDSVAFTPSGRLAAMQQRLEAMQKAMETVRGPLDAFYSSLTDEQKAKFVAAASAPPPDSGQQTPRYRPLAQSCTTASSATEWPEGRLQAVLRPKGVQRAKLKALQSTMVQAAEQLAASCPGGLPATPPARLEAIAKRLDAMLTVVKSVREAVDDLYASLSDEQKEHFNQLGSSQRQS